VQKLGEKRQGLSEKTMRLGMRNKYHRAQASVVHSFHFVKPKKGR